jgi:hypothetical protein
MTFKQFYLISLFGITCLAGTYLLLLWISHSKKSKLNNLYKEVNQGLIFIVFAVFSWSIVSVYKVFDLQEFTLSYLINDRILSSMNNLFFFLSLAYIPVQKKNFFTSFFVKKDKWLLNVFLIFSVVITFFTITDKIGSHFNLLARVIIISLDSIFSISCLFAIGYVLYISFSELGFNKLILTYLKIIIGLLAATQIILPLSKMIPGLLNDYYPVLLACFIIFISQFILLLVCYYSVLYFSYANNLKADTTTSKTPNINAQEISELLGIEIGYEKSSKQFYLSLSFKDQFNKQQKEINENPKLLQPLIYWVLFSVAKKNKAMLYHQDLAIAKFRMVDYWNKDSNYKLSQELLFFNESGNFEFKINGHDISFNDFEFIKSKSPIKDAFKKHFICFISNEIKNTAQLNNKKNADKYTTDHFDDFYFNL